MPLVRTRHFLNLPRLATDGRCPQSRTFANHRLCNCEKAAGVTTPEAQSPLQMRTSAPPQCARVDAETTHLHDQPFIQRVSQPKTEEDRSSTSHKTTRSPSDEGPGRTPPTSLLDCPLEFGFESAPADHERPTSSPPSRQNSSASSSDGLFMVRRRSGSSMMPLGTRNEAPVSSA